MLLEFKWPADERSGGRTGLRGRLCVTVRPRSPTVRVIDGVLSYLVTQQRRELGIRLALGARPETVLRRVMSQGLRPALVGLAAGLLATIALTRLMDALLFEVRPNDPVTLAAVAGGITCIAAAACLVPAYRATRLDPVETLRE